MRKVNLRTIDLNLLVIFDALLTAKNITRAAEEIGMSQPAMSRALGRLRALFDDPLLARTKKGYVLSPRAEELRGQLETALNNITGLITPTTFDPSTISDTFRIAMLDHPSFLILPSLLAQVDVLAPRLGINILSLHGDVFTKLADNSIDLAVSLFEDTPAGFYRQSLYDENLKTILREKHPALSDWNIKTFAKQRHALVSVSGDDKGSYLDKILMRKGLTRNIAARVPHFLILPKIIQGSDLIATVPARLAKEFAADYELEVVDPPIPSSPFSLSQLWHERRHKDPLHQWIRQRIKEVAESL